MIRRPPRPPLFPYTTLFRSTSRPKSRAAFAGSRNARPAPCLIPCRGRSEEHTSELQSQSNLAFPLFFFNDTAPTETSPLPLHDALPIYFKTKEQSRIRWITEREAGALLDSLPGHTEALVRFLLLTGVRRREAFELTWG